MHITPSVCFSDTNVYKQRCNTLLVYFWYFCMLSLCNKSDINYTEHHKTDTNRNSNITQGHGCFPNITNTEYFKN